MEIITFVSEGQTLQGALFTKTNPLPPSNSGSGSYTPPVSAVILCHGAFEDRENWVDYARRLADQGFPTLSLDFVGHGASSGQRGLVDLRLWAYNLRDSMNVLAKRGYRHFALVGWGSGGSATLLAAAHDRRITCSVVLAAPVQLTPPLSERVVFVLASALSWIRSKLKMKPLTLSRVESYEKLQFAVNEQVDQAYKANLHLRETLQAVPIPGSLDSAWVDITKAVVQIKTPVLVIHGRQDRIVSLKQSEKLLSLLPGMKRLVVIDETGHALHQDQRKDEVYKEIARWIKHYLA